jgi:hypothetical protein
VSERFALQVNNFQTVKKTEDCSEQGPKLKKQTVVDEKWVTVAIARTPLKANGLLLMPTWSCSARISCPGFLLHILI